jgi:two-component system nitrate/nitrite response regulator NarL
MDIPERLERLTPGEKTVLRLVSESMTTREIAGLLALSEKTVENRRCAIAQKLGLGGTRRLAMFAFTYRSML